MVWAMKNWLASGYPHTAAAKACKAAGAQYPSMIVLYIYIFPRSS